MSGGDHVRYGVGLATAVEGSYMADFPQVNAFPRRNDPLHVCAEMPDELMRGNYWNEGTITPLVVFPPPATAPP